MENLIWLGYLGIATKMLGYFYLVLVFFYLVNYLSFLRHRLHIFFLAASASIASKCDLSEMSLD